MAFLPVLCGSRIEERTLPDSAKRPVGRNRRRKKGPTKASMRKMVKQLLKFFRENPDVEIESPKGEPEDFQAEAA